MTDTNPFLPLSQSDLDTNNHLQRKARLSSLILGVFFVLLAVGFLVIKNYDGDNEGFVVKDDHGREPENVNLENLRRFASRGKSAGVSEKANNIFLLTKNKSNGMLEEVEGFPWTNDMLSWQRTAFHFQPRHNWMNDPSGPLYYKGWYHFFYQYNPNAAYWGDIVWGHAVSRDMIHWFHLPYAMGPDQWFDIGGCFTGSATILPNGKVIMLYTGAKSDLEQIQNLAYPEDENDPLLLKWKKYSGNPILVRPPGILPKDFRDPSTAWYTSEGKWRISIGTKVNRTGVALVYETTDFINYELLPGYLHGVSGTGEWECIDFYPVSTIDDHGLDTSFNGPEVKHVLKESGDDDRHDWYAIGTYDEKNVKWTPDNPDIDVGVGLRYDYGVFYASKSFYDPKKERRILWGYIHEGDSEAADVKKGWATVQSMPRTILLDRKTKDHLLQWPVEEVESLRLRSQEFNNVEVMAGSVMPLDLEGATQLDIIAEFELDKNALESTIESDIKDISCSMNGAAAQRGALGPFGFMVLADKNLTERTPVYFYVAKGHNETLRTLFCIDQTRSSIANDVNKLIYGSDVPVLDGEKLIMRILVDHSIIEGYAQGGRTCITSRVYPTKAIYGAAKLFLFNNAKHVNVTATLKIWQMNSALIRPYSSE